MIYPDEILYTVHQDVAKVFLKIARHVIADSRKRNKGGAKKPFKFAFYSAKCVCVAQAEFVNCVMFEAKSDCKVGRILGKDVCEIF